MLQGKYFTINSKEKREENTTIFSVTLNPNHPVYKGHFPDMPVCPGVCSIQMIRECAEVLTSQKLSIENISQCKFAALITPSDNKDLTITLTVLESNEMGYKVKGSITSSNAETVFIEYKGEYKISI